MKATASVFMDVLYMRGNVCLLLNIFSNFFMEL